MPNDMQMQIQTEAAIPRLELREPRATDGEAIWRLIRACKPLDQNSLYANLIQADHFADTCVVAEAEGEILGWISGHMIPKENAFFVWQVAVSPDARGLGLGRRMLSELLSRDAVEGADCLKTTITDDNDASWGLFRSFARQVGGKLSDRPYFRRDTHFGGRHDTEHMVTITLPQQEDASRKAA